MRVIRSGCHSRARRAAHRPAIWLLSATVVAVLAPLEAAAVRPIAIGSPTVLDVGRTAEEPSHGSADPEIAVSPNRDSVIVWSKQLNVDGHRRRGVAARSVDFLGQGLSSLVWVNETFGESSYYDPVLPRVAADLDGTVLASWSVDFDGRAPRIVARTLDAALAPSRRETIVDHSDETRATNEFSAVACGVLGDCLIAWTSIDDAGIVARRRRLNGTLSRMVFRLGTKSARYQAVPRIAPRATGGFVAIWTRLDPGPNDSGRARVVARMLDARGRPIGGEIVADEPGQRGAHTPEVATFPDDGFVVVWLNQAYEDGPLRLRAQRFRADGSRAGSVIDVDQLASARPEDPAVVAFSDGAFAVAWTRYIEGPPGGWSNEGVFARSFTRSNVPESDDFAIDTNWGSAPTLAAVEDGFVAAWQSGNFGINWQRFTRRPVCGDANGDGVVIGTDSLAILRAAVGLDRCEVCVCDVDESGAISASDAQAVLDVAGGAGGVLVCDICK